jgi:hypothetical protein
MKIKDTQVEENKKEPNDNMRTGLLEQSCHEMRILMDGLQKVIGGYEKIDPRDPDDDAKLAETKILNEQYKDAYRRTKNLLGVHEVEQ